MTTPKDRYDVEAQAVFNSIDAERSSVGGIKILAAALRQAAQEADRAGFRRGLAEANIIAKQADKAGYERGREEGRREAFVEARSTLTLTLLGSGLPAALKKAMFQRFDEKARPTPVPTKECAMFHDHDTDGCAADNEPPLVPCCLCPDNHYPECPRYKAPEPSAGPCEGIKHGMRCSPCVREARECSPEPSAKPCDHVKSRKREDCHACSTSDAEAKPCEMCDGSGEVSDGEAWEQDTPCPKCRPDFK